jgi:lipopolysaccharide/colanic/teichoic acid biosynthesis glycosyltransferase
MTVSPSDPQTIPRVLPEALPASGPAVPGLPALALGTGRRAEPGAASSRVEAAAKRAFDVVVSLVLLLLLVPVIAVAAALVALESGRPVFFRCRRVGYRWDQLDVLKFRKMRRDARGLPLTTAADDRFTRIGPWLAKFKLDEIPQLWQVLRGEMSLVGPRPEDDEFVQQHSAAYHGIVRVRPGITGLSQIAFAEESRILDQNDPLGHYVRRILPQKVLLDTMYAQRAGLGFDLRILFWTTAAVVLRRQVAVHRDCGKMNLRRR